MINKHWIVNLNISPKVWLFSLIVSTPKKAILSSWFQLLARDTCVVAHAQSTLRLRFEEDLRLAVSYLPGINVFRSSPAGTRHHANSGTDSLLLAWHAKLFLISITLLLTLGRKSRIAQKERNPDGVTTTRQPVIPWLINVYLWFMRAPSSRSPINVRPLGMPPHRIESRDPRKICIIPPLNNELIPVQRHCMSGNLDIETSWRAAGLWWLIDRCQKIESKINSFGFGVFGRFLFLN